jgi:hypothetical protein
MGLAGEGLSRDINLFVLSLISKSKEKMDILFCAKLAVVVYPTDVTY